MTRLSIPRALHLLKAEKNPLADAALVEALPMMEGDGQVAALKLLASRGHRASQSSLVARFEKLDSRLADLVAENAAGLHTGIRAAVYSSALPERLAAVALIERSGDARLAYLLADAVRSGCTRTQERAASALWNMTDHLLGRRCADIAAGAAGLRAQGKLIGEALQHVIAGWELHLQPKALEAALWLSEQTEGTIREKLAEPHSAIARAINRTLRAPSHERLAAFTLRALGIPELRSSAAGTISASGESAFQMEVLRESWLLADPEIERGFPWIRDSAWFLHRAIEPAEDGVSLADRIPRLIMATGATQEQKLEGLKVLLRSGDPAVERAALWQLVTDDSSAATNLLTLLCDGGESGTARIVAREVRRRRWRHEGLLISRAGELPDADNRGAPSAPSFERLFHEYETLSHTQREEAGHVLRAGSGDGLFRLKLKLGASDPAVRLRALRLVQDYCLTHEMEDHVRRLAGAVDPMVRSFAVAMLADLPGPITERILRAAADDRDPRVQANAIEALDRLNVKGRAVCTLPKLESTNSRVRANAVHSLLGLELQRAGEALLDMLEDASSDHRLSALWVIERMELHALLQRVVEISQRDGEQRVRARARRVLQGLAGLTSAIGTTSRSAKKDLAGEARI